MQFKSFAAALAAVATVFGATSADAASMWPLKDRGISFGEQKGQMVTVGNPYNEAEKFELFAVDVDYATPIDGVKISPAAFTLAPGATRRVKIVFDIPNKERTIAVCAQKIPEPGAMVIPRVCGRYTGVRAGLR